MLPDKLSENLPDALSNDYDTLDKLSNYCAILDKLSNDYNSLDRLSNDYDIAIGQNMHICRILPKITTYSLHRTKMVGKNTVPGQFFFCNPVDACFFSVKSH